MQRKKKSFSATWLIILICSPSLVLSDISTDELFELSMDELLDIEVEIVTGNTQKLSHAPAVASVISAAEIKAMGVTEFSQVLGMIPGVYVYPDPVARMDSHFSIRGIQTADNSQVLILLDGHDMTYVATGSTPQNFRMPVANISRIEVMRSPGSALYGADAFAGVINIITKQADEIDGSEAGWRQGSFNTQDIWLQHGASLDGEWNLAFSLETSSSGGDDGRIVQFNDEAYGFVDSGALQTYYDYTNTQVTLSNSDWRFKLWNWNLDKAGNGQGAAQVVDPVGNDQSKLYLLDVNHEKKDLFVGWNLSSRFSFELVELDSQFVLYPPVAPYTDGIIGNPGATQRKGVLSFRADYAALSGHRLLLGVGTKWVEVDPRETKNFATNAAEGVLQDVTGTQYAFMGRETRTVNHIFLQDEWDVNDDWALTAGVRYDNYSDFGNTTNPRMAVVWKGLSQLTTKLVYGRAFRAPAFSELYFRNNPASIGNPNVSSESIDTYEAVLDYRPVAEFNLVLSIFRYYINDLIDRSFGVPAQNIGKQNGNGFELEANWHVNSKLQLRSFYAFQHAEDGVTAEDVPNAPQQQFYASAHWGVLPQWFLGTQMKWIADRERAAGDPRPDIGDYTIIDATLKRRQLLPNMDFTFSVRNLFDENAREPSLFEPAHTLGATIPGDYPLAGRSFYGEISFDL